MPAQQAITFIAATGPQLPQSRKPSRLKGCRQEPEKSSPIDFQAQLLQQPAAAAYQQIFFLGNPV